MHVLIQDNVINLELILMSLSININSCINMDSIRKRNMMIWGLYAFWDIMATSVIRSGIGWISSLLLLIPVYLIFIKNASTIKLSNPKASNTRKVEENSTWLISLIATIMSESTSSSTNHLLMNNCMLILFISQCVVMLLLNIILSDNNKVTISILNWLKQN